MTVCAVQKSEASVTLHPSLPFSAYCFWRQGLSLNPAHILLHEVGTQKTSAVLSLPALRAGVTGMCAEAWAVTQVWDLNSGIYDFGSLTSEPSLQSQYTKFIPKKKKKNPI